MQPGFQGGMPQPQAPGTGGMMPQQNAPYNNYQGG